MAKKLHSALNAVLNQSTVFFNSNELCRHVILLSILNAFIFTNTKLSFLVKVLALSLSKIFSTHSLTVFLISWKLILNCNWFYFSHLKILKIITCFLIQAVIPVAFNSSVGTQIDSKSKIATYKLIFDLQCKQLYFHPVSRMLFPVTSTRFWNNYVELSS